MIEGLFGLFLGRRAKEGRILRWYIMLLDYERNARNREYSPVTSLTIPRTKPKEKLVWRSALQER